eukprot:CAMPEP_0195131938 /NCGR_PEP_ID=MMETSP0448-20130528/145992_1 /TAXON_ID=66468 /ORGANISM="Heterocapsa triquestra, Strain CCMP 448" /LENGTH=220 /DNA_ID=CAMNT_0040169919 /DNA_START=47 /DNA_END=706 /DNA_ORIENTATION=-
MEADNASSLPPQLTPCQSASPPFLWAVVGGGPCGIIAVALLVEQLKCEEEKAASARGMGSNGICNGSKAVRKVAWIDPWFRVGNLTSWRNVQANSSVQAICSSFASLPALRFQATQQARAERGMRTLSSLLPQDVTGSAGTDGIPQANQKKKRWCELGLVVDALADATQSLLRDSYVAGFRGQVSSLELSGGLKGEQRRWRMECSAPPPCVAEEDEEEEE